jgi:rsbT co-antagonist protein RsbR
MPKTSSIAKIVADDEDRILADWLEALKQGTSLWSGRITELQVQTQARDFLRRLREAMASSSDAGSAGFDSLREMLGEISRSRAIQGFTPTETATFVFSLKEAMFASLNRAGGKDAELIARGTWEMTQVLDTLGLYTIEVFQKTREEVIARQQREIAELSTPVVKLWDGVLALPLIGTLDSERTQVVMENLLQSLIDHNAEIAIIDITGVPTVDTLVAQHLLKTISAARLMGADCIVSGIRPQIAQTMVHLGVELNVVSKASLADAFGLALQRIGRTVVRTKSLPQAKAGAGTPD